MKTFYDILWVEDEHEVSEYFSQKHYFRVDHKKYMLKLLEDLERQSIKLANNFPYRKEVKKMCRRPEKPSWLDKWFTVVY